MPRVVNRVYGYDDDGREGEGEGDDGVGDGGRGGDGGDAMPSDDVLGCDDKGNGNPHDADDDDDVILHADDGDAFREMPYSRLALPDDEFVIGLRSRCFAITILWPAVVCPSRCSRP